MKVAVNDLAFEFPLHERTKTMEAVKRFICICQRLESLYCHNVERLIRTDIDREKELYPGGNLYRIVQEIKDRDDRKYFLGLLVNREKADSLPEKAFVYKNKKSFACALARKEALVSLETEEGFKQVEVTGTIGNEKVSIRNISNKEHINHYWKSLGIRIYEANDEKHKKDRYNAYGKGKIASPMDLPDEEAQELLNHAIWINDRLYARKGKRNYAFQKTRDCIYHAYIADDLDDSIVSRLLGEKWD